MAATTPPVPDLVIPIPGLLACPACRRAHDVSVHPEELGHDFKATLVYTCYACGVRWIRPVTIVTHPANLPRPN